MRNKIHESLSVILDRDSFNPSPGKAATYFFGYSNSPYYPRISFWLPLPFYVTLRAGDKMDLTEAEVIEVRDSIDEGEIEISQSVRSYSSVEMFVENPLKKGTYRPVIKINRETLSLMRKFKEYFHEIESKTSKN